MRKLNMIRKMAMVLAAAMMISSMSGVSVNNNMKVVKAAETNYGDGWVDPETNVTYVYEYDRTVKNAPAEYVYVFGDEVATKDGTLVNNLVIPEYFENEDGRHYVKSLGKGVTEGATYDSFFDGIDSISTIDITIDASNCSQLETIGNAFGYGHRGMTLILPKSVKTIKHNFFGSSQGNKIVCENPNVEIFDSVNNYRDNRFLAFDVLNVPKYSTLYEKWFWEASSEEDKDAIELGESWYYNNLGTKVNIEAFKVRFDGNGDDTDPVTIESGIRKDSVYLYTDYLSLDASYERCSDLDFIPTRLNYTFDGYWDGDNQLIDANGHVIVENVKGYSAVTDEFTTYNEFGSHISNLGQTAVTAKAKWIPNKYTVTYELNTNGITGEAGQKKTADYKTNIQTENPTVAGYIFKGWDTDASAKTVVYEANAEYTIMKNTTLYAVWEKDPDYVAPTPTPSATIEPTETPTTAPTATIEAPTTEPSASVKPSESASAIPNTVPSTAPTASSNTGSTGGNSGTTGGGTEGNISGGSAGGSTGGNTGGNMNNGTTPSETPSIVPTETPAETVAPSEEPTKTPDVTVEPTETSTVTPSEEPTKTPDAMTEPTENPSSSAKPVQMASVKIAGSLYKISGNAVTFAKANSKAKKVTIRSTVTINDKKYKITKISANAMKNRKKLKSIVIKSKYLKSVGKNAIKGINKKTVIKVPKKSLKKYKKLICKKSTGWKKSMKIK